MIVIGYARIVIASRDQLSLESRKRSKKLINRIKEIFELKYWPPRIAPVMAGPAPGIPRPHRGANLDATVFEAAGAYQNSRPVCPAVVAVHTGAVTQVVTWQLSTFARPVVPDCIGNCFRLLSAFSDCSVPFFDCSDSRFFLLLTD